MKDFWATAQVCRASAKAAQMIRLDVADKFTVIDGFSGGWQSYLPVKSELLHGPTIITTALGYDIRWFKFGRLCGSGSWNVELFNKKMPMIGRVVIIK